MAVNNNTPFKTNYKDGDSLGPTILNRAFSLIEIFRQINNKTASIFKLNGKRVYHNDEVDLSAKDISYNPGIDNVENTVGGVLSNLTNLYNSNPAVVKKLQTARLDDVITNGLYYIADILGDSPEPLCDECYLQVIKTTAQFFIQQVWLVSGSVYTRVHTVDGYGAWKPL